MLKFIDRNWDNKIPGKVPLFKFRLVVVMVFKYIAPSQHLSVIIVCKNYRYIRKITIDSNTCYQSNWKLIKQSNK